MKMLRKDVIIYFIILAFVPVFLIVTVLYAKQDKKTNKEYLFYKGNEHYEAGRYDDAIEAYEKIIDQGIESGNLFYNLGNSYFRKSDLGRAMLNYERAKRLIPRDSDLEINFRFAKSRARSSIDENRQSLFAKTIRLFDAYSLSELTIILSVLLLLVVIFFIARLYFSAIRRVLLLYLSLPTVLFILIGIVFFGRLSMLDKEGVIISESSEAGFEPLENATIHFTLYEGMKVSVIQVKKNWVKIRRSDGKTGWIRTGEIGMVSGKDSLQLTVNRQL